MYKKILVPLDGSKLAESVLVHVRPLAKSMQSEVVLLRVVSLPVSSYVVVTEPRLVVDANADAEAQARDYLKGIAATLKTEGIQTSVEIGTGVIGETIQKFAVDVRADLIAMSTHGRGGLARLVIGSVADQLVRNSEVPILLIRPAREKK